MLCYKPPQLVGETGPQIKEKKKTSLCSRKYNRRDTDKVLQGFRGGCCQGRGRNQACHPNGMFKMKLEEKYFYKR